MYKRLDEKEKQVLREKFEKRQEYMVAYNAINVTSERYGDLSPEEIWNEALSIVDEISNATQRTWKVDKVFSQLKRKYSSIEDEHGDCVKRSDKQQELTATLVLFDVVCMLSLAKRLDPEQAEQHPYFEYMKHILRFFCESVLFQAMLAVLQQDEEDVEAITGQELQPSDYLSNKPILNTEKEVISLADEHMRIELLRRVYVALKEQLGESFTGRSQWFYVYRMMADCKAYENGSYTQFASDLKAAGVTKEHLPNTSTFSRKQGQLKAGMTYPNWQTKTGGKQTILDEGKRIARIAFDILYK